MVLNRCVYNKYGRKVVRRINGCFHVQSAWKARSNLDNEAILKGEDILYYKKINSVD